MNYKTFATLYDSLMQDAPYDEWVHYIKRCTGRSHLANLDLLDVGCGTGELLLRLHEEGANVTGVDLSAEMLAIAREKFMEVGFQPLLLEQSMTELEGLPSFDLITIFCDSLNYLETPDDVKKTFQCMYEYLRDDGLLLFDVHSISKIEHGFVNCTFAEDGDEIAYIWTAFAGEHVASVEHELSFFIRTEEGHYVKKEELHKQRTYSIEEYKQWLDEAGFKVEVSADFKATCPTEESERIFFKASKKNKGFSEEV